MATLQCQGQGKITQPHALPSDLQDQLSTLYLFLSNHSIHTCLGLTPARNWISHRFLLTGDNQKGESEKTCELREKEENTVVIITTIKYLEYTRERVRKCVS